MFWRSTILGDYWGVLPREAMRLRRCYIEDGSEIERASERNQILQASRLGFAA